MSSTSIRFPVALLGSAVLWLDHSAAQTLEWHVNPTSEVWQVEMEADHDGDGLADVLVGDPGAGLVQLLSGATGSIVWTHSSPSLIGLRLCALDDMNGDGLAEVAACSQDGVHLLSGADGSELHLIPSSANQLNVAAVDDVNGDGYLDLALCGPIDGDLEVYSGRRMITGLGPVVLWSVPFPHAGSQFGAGLCSLADIDGDGVREVAVGAPREDGTAGFLNYFGRVYLFSGADGSEIWHDNLWDALGTNPDWGYGSVLAPIDDFNGNGTEDLLVGVPYVDDVASDAGAVHILDGGSGSTIATFQQGVSGLALGRSVEAVGDLDGLGRSEFLVGDAIRVQLVHGETLSVLQVTSGLSGIGADGNLSGGVDATGDGVPDYVVGANGSSIGDVLLYRGDCVGDLESYCVGAPNSFSPNGGELRVFGSQSLADNTMSLQARQCPPNQPGLFFYGAGRTQTPFGDGFLCVTAPLFRVNPPAYTNGVGIASRALDFGAPPFSSGPGRITAGSSWCFQYWVRDPFAGGTGHTLTDAMEVSFCP